MSSQNQTVGDYAQIYLLKVTATHKLNSHFSGREVTSLCYHIANWLCCQTTSFVVWHVTDAYCAYEKECVLWWVKSPIFHWILRYFLFCYLSLLLQSQCFGSQMKHGCLYAFIQKLIACQTNQENVNKVIRDQKELWCNLVDDLFTPRDQAPDCTSLISLRHTGKGDQQKGARREDAMESSEVLQSGFCCLYSSFTQCTLCFFRLETLLEFVFSPLVSVT